MVKKLTLLLVLFMATGQLLLAQVTTSSLTGIVKDGANQPLAGATVVATYLPTGTRYSAATQPGGTFNIVNMQPGGPYRVEVSYVGFETQAFDEITLKLAESFILNPIMQAGTTTLQQVVVASGRRNSILNAGRTGATTNIGSREIARLPTISRSLNDFTRLTPQANGTSIGGGNYRQNYITVDGSDFNNTFGIGTNLPANGSPISLDAIEEISVNVTPFDIRQSNFIGSAINSITRSGTNNFTGSVYTFFRNENQQGNKVNGNQFLRQRSDFKQYGVRLGGPIIKNKLFFFISGETEDRTVPGQQRFAATAASGAGSYGSAPNIARPTVAELDGIADYLRRTYGYETGGYQGYDFVTDQTKLLARIDWIINDNNRLNVRYNQVEGKTPSFVSGSTSSTGVSYGSGAGRTDINALHFKNSNYFQENNFYTGALELNSKFSQRVANTFRVSYNNQNEPRSTESAVFPFVDIMKDGLPFTSFGHEPFSLGNLRDVETYSVTDNLTWNRGKHNMLFGAQAEWSTVRNGFQPLGMSYYRFNSFEDFQNGVNPLDFALTYSLNPDYSQAFPTFKFFQLSAYAQDEIVLNNQFRLTLGLRADRTSYPDVTELKTNPLVAGLTFAEGKTINTGSLPEPKVMFSPRVGFNYDVFGDRSLQLRGGTGIFTGRVPFVWIVGQSGNSGMLQVTQSFNGQTNTPGPFSPEIGTYRPATVPVAGTVIPSTVTAFDDNFKMPQTWKSSLALDKRLPGGLVATLEAIYNRDVNVLYSNNVNLANQTALNISGYGDNRLMYPTNTPDKFLNPLTGARASATNPNPSTPVPQGDVRGTQLFNAILSGNENRGYYFSMTAKLEKQFTSGFFASLAYVKTVSSNLYDGNGDQPFNTWSLIQTVNGANNPMLSYANYVVPHRVVGSVSYRKEYLKHLGTTVSLFYEGSIQGRFSYTYTNDFNRDLQANDLIYIPADASQITFFDRAASAATGGVAYTAQQQSDLFFQYVAQDKYLNDRRGQYAERNGAKLPWRNQFDLRLLQDVFTNIGNKRNTLQLSVDIFNFANLLNSDWGITQTTNASSLLEIVNVPGNRLNRPVYNPNGTVRPEYWLALDRGKPVTETFRDNQTLASTYYMQFGLRYIFGN